MSFIKKGERVWRGVSKTSRIMIAFFSVLVSMIVWFAAAPQAIAVSNAVPEVCGNQCRPDQICVPVDDQCEPATGNVGIYHFQCSNGWINCKVDSCQNPTPAPTTTPACNSQCNNNNDCSLAGQCSACLPNGGGQNTCQVPPTPTPQPNLACNATCQGNSDCASGFCFQGQCRNPSCQDSTSCSCPVATPSPSPPPACNSQCNNNNDCSLAGQCTACLPNGGGINTCQVPPTPPPTPPPTSPPTPSPTPGFSPDMCKCDGMDTTDITPGQQTTFTAFAKVEGADTSKAQVNDIRFFLGAGDSDNATIIGQSGPVQSQVIANNPNLVRYQSTWQQQIPQLEKGKIYRAWVQIDCAQKGPASTVNSLVLGSSSQNSSIWDIIGSWFSRLIGRGSATPTPRPSSRPTPTSPGNKKLQLNTFTLGQPSLILEKSCKLIRFQAQ